MPRILHKIEVASTIHWCEHSSSMTMQARSQWACVYAAIHAHSLRALDCAAHSTRHNLLLMTRGKQVDHKGPLALAACGAATTASARLLPAPAACILQITAAHPSNQAQLGAQQTARRPALPEVSTDSRNDMQAPLSTQGRQHAAELTHLLTQA